MVISDSNLVEIFTVRGDTRDTLSSSVGRADRKYRSMVDIQHIESRNQQKTSSNRRNIVICKEIGAKKSNADVVSKF